MTTDSTTTAPSFRSATPSDRAGIEQLLVSAGLPTAGVADIVTTRPADFVVVEAPDDAGRPQLIAAGGLEVCCDNALLRSVAVRRDWQARGIGHDLIRRIDEHRSGKVKGFTAQYKINQLAYYEAHSDPRSAIEREKQIKGRTRAKKVALIESMNPHWQDLSNNLKPRDEVGVARGPLGEGPDFVVRSEILRCAQDDGLAPSESRGTRPL